jgi:hypothetical protein
MQGDPEAGPILADLAKTMTAAEIDTAKRLASDWTPTAK